jgi:hypothetical protein
MVLVHFMSHISLPQEYMHRTGKKSYGGSVLAFGLEMQIIHIIGIVSVRLQFRYPPRYNSPLVTRMPGKPYVRRTVVYRILEQIQVLVLIVCVTHLTTPSRQVLSTHLEF